jgi:nitrite reductase/ring-hydroxylating ferredoxin subunit
MQLIRLFTPLRSSPKLQYLLRPNSLRTARFSTTISTMAQEYKLKGITSLNLKNGEKQEVEVEGVEGGKVLLLKVQDKVHATSANCTHYGAPLKSGVLTPEGRLTCPWHGGQFVCRMVEYGLRECSMLQCRDRRRRGCPCARSAYKVRRFRKGRSCLCQDGRGYAQGEPEIPQPQVLSIDQR